MLNQRRIIKQITKQITKKRSYKKDYGSKKRNDSFDKKYHKPRDKKVEKPSGKAFTEFDLDPTIVAKLKEHNFTHSSLVQEKSIPVALAGKNIFCSSETGSGKTLAFLIPMIQKFLKKEINQALIICPTREIAIQIQKILALFESDDITHGLVIGGTNVELQKILREYPKVLVATPGRLLDMLNTGLIWLELYRICCA